MRRQRMGTVIEVAQQSLVMIATVLSLIVMISGGCGDDSPTQPPDNSNNEAADDTTGGDDTTGTSPEDTSGTTPEDTTDTDPADTIHVLFRVTVPENTPLDSNVFIAGDFQGWNPGDSVYMLTRLSPVLHEISLSLDRNSSIQFKFTLGDWSRVEKGPNGEEIGNRTHTVTGTDTLELAVEMWSGLIPHTYSGNVNRITLPGFLGGRDVWIYLPPGYFPKTVTAYPVLYMLDGQNIFDAATSFAGEWEVDETCELLIGLEEIEPLIVIAIANGEIDRIDEYTPWYDPGFYGGMGGGGEGHVQAIIDTLIPYINSNYHTLTGPENTGFAGSSLGGLMALYTAYAHPETFGRIGSFSPSLWWDSMHLESYIDSLVKQDAKIYMDMGTIEAGYTVDDDLNGVDDNIDMLRSLRDVLIEQGFTPGDDLMIAEDEGGTHSETFWAARFPDMMRFLFPSDSP